MMAQACLILAIYENNLLSNNLFRIVLSSTLSITSVTNSVPVLLAGLCRCLKAPAQVLVRTAEGHAL